MLGGEQNVVKAVDGLSFQVFPGETLGLVGESGSGKTTVGRAMLRALRLTGGAITFHIGNQDIQLANLSNSELRKFRSHIQLIFQDPYAALDRCQSGAVRDLNQHHGRDRHGRDRHDRDRCRLGATRRFG